MKRLAPVILVALLVGCSPAEPEPSTQTVSAEPAPEASTPAPEATPEATPAPEATPEPTPEPEPEIASTVTELGTQAKLLGIRPDTILFDRHGQYTSTVLSLPHMVTSVPDMLRADEEIMLRHTPDSAQDLIDAAAEFLVEGTIDTPLMFDTSEEAAQMYYDKVFPRLTADAQVLAENAVFNGIGQIAVSDYYGLMDANGVVPDYDGNVRYAILDLTLEDVHVTNTRDLAVYFYAEVAVPVTYAAEEGEVNGVHMTWLRQVYHMTDDAGTPKVANWTQKANSFVLSRTEYDAYMYGDTLPEGLDASMLHDVEKPEL